MSAPPTIAGGSTASLVAAGDAAVGVDLPAGVHSHQATEVHVPNTAEAIAAGAAETHAVELHPIGAHEKVGKHEEIVVDKKTGRHFKKVYRRKAPVYNVGKSRGAPLVAPMPERKNAAKVGLGHAIRDTNRMQAHKQPGQHHHHGHHSSKPSSVHEFGAGAPSPRSLDLNRNSERMEMLASMRQIIAEEVGRLQSAHSLHTENIAKEAVGQAIEAHAEQQERKELVEAKQQKQRRKKRKQTGDTEEAAADDMTDDDSTAEDEEESGVYGKESGDSEGKGKVLAGADESRSSFDSFDSASSGGSDELDFPNACARLRYHLREPLAEALGTFVLVTFGDGANLQVTLSSTINAASPKGDYLSVAFCWGVGVALGVWTAGGISGGHINPVVTIALALFRGFPWKKVPLYILGQMIGAFFAALMLYGTFVNPIRLVDPDQTTATASLFATYPADFLLPHGARIAGFLNEVYATGILLVVILAIGDSENVPPVDGMAPLVLLFLVMGIGSALGYQTGFALNPARDLGPRIMLSMVGYSRSVVWSYNGGYVFWTPFLGPLVGAIVGGFLYDAFCYTGGESPLNKKWDWEWRNRLRAKRGKKRVGGVQPDSHAAPQQPQVEVSQEKGDNAA